MGIGISILLMVAGAILTFAINARVKGFDLDNVGIILLIAGAVSFVITMVIWGKGRTTVVTRPTYVEPPADPTAARHVVEERHSYPPPPNS